MLAPNPPTFEMLPPSDAQWNTNAWKAIKPRIKQALQAVASNISMMDVRMSIASKDMICWLIRDAGEIKGVIVGEVVYSTLGKTLALPVVQSDDMARHLVPTLKMAEAYARMTDCTRLEGCGRAGWEKALAPHGWEKILTVVAKDLTDGK